MVRVLETKGEQCLIIQMDKKQLPYWVDKSEVKRTEVVALPFAEPELSPKESCMIQQRFTMIADIIDVIGDKKKRTAMIKEAAEEYGVSEMTIRNYLISYLQGGK